MRRFLTHAARVAFLAALIGLPISADASSALLGPDWTPPIYEPQAAVPPTAQAAATKALRAGKQAAQVAFKNPKGEKVTLESLIADGPVILIFYRGGWCPYCVKQLKDFEQHRADIEQAGARVVAVSTELPEHAGNTKEKNKLGFAVLSDPEAVASRAFGVAWANERYGPGLERYNGNDKGEIPLGVTYLIDTNATIRWAFLEDDYKKRATPDQAIEAINALD